MLPVRLSSTRLCARRIIRLVADLGSRARKVLARLRHIESADDNAVLSIIMQSLKGYTARKCNIALGRRGAFWQHESFDRAIRDEEEFDRTVRYVLDNPVKAGLVTTWRDWKWTYCRPQLIAASGSTE